MRSLPLDILKKNLAMIYQKYRNYYEDKYEMDALNHVLFNYLKYKL